MTGVSLGGISSELSVSEFLFLTNRLNTPYFLQMLFRLLGCPTGKEVQRGHQSRRLQFSRKSMVLYGNYRLLLLEYWKPRKVLVVRKTKKAYLQQVD